MLARRACLLADTRVFFAARDVLEVETPLLGRAATPDAHVRSLEVHDAGHRTGFLQFSPEFAMKRLLCGGSGPIYQIGKAFRGGESGRWHNPEFTMLEWYRPGWEQHALMDEVDALLRFVSGGALGAARRLTVGEAFEAAMSVHWRGAEDAMLARLAEDAGVAGAGGLDRGDLLDALLALVVQPSLGLGAVFLHDFPPEQAALARLGESGAAERFELYVDGLELANGYHELTDADECRSRMQAENARRRKRGQAQMPLDEKLLAAMRSGLPACAGVALGMDRLLAVLCGADSLAEVLAFPATHA